MSCTEKFPGPGAVRGTFCSSQVWPLSWERQRPKGTLLGTVTDSTGASVPGATVTVTEVQTGISRSVTTNASGNYVFSNLKDGVYRVEAELSGFRKTVRENVRVDVNTTVRVDLTLQVGSLNEAVTVVQEAPPLQTDRADTGRIIESKQVTEMPLSFNRNFQGLLVTVPGATRPFRPTPSSSTPRTASRPTSTGRRAWPTT